MLNLQWNAVLLYPAGHFSRRIAVEPSVTLPTGWQVGCALDVASVANDTTIFGPVALDVLIDSPLFAGAHYRRIALDDAAKVNLNIFADTPDLLAATDEQIAPHRAMVAEADALFGARHFDRYESKLPLRVAALRFSSREMVLGDRQSLRAMALIPLPFATSIAISSRSGNVG
ncbi:M61 family metallopeptidase [Sphingomonas sp. PB4P5]|uniref:M61 family metallopeptidase n=1 Tax=Parasphingomonas puruogangriensis TaxID=3096155 RepID=UPI002FC665B2